MKVSHCRDFIKINKNWYSNREKLKTRHIFSMFQEVREVISEKSTRFFAWNSSLGIFVGGSGWAKSGKGITGGQGMLIEPDKPESQLLGEPER